MSPINDLFSSLSSCTIHFSWNTNFPLLLNTQSSTELKTVFLNYCITLSFCISLHSRMIHNAPNLTRNVSTTSNKWILTKPEVLEPIYMDLFESHKFHKVCIVQLARVIAYDLNGTPHKIAVHDSGEFGAPHITLVASRFNLIASLGDQNKRRAVRETKNLMHTSKNTKGKTGIKTHKHNSSSKNGNKGQHFGWSTNGNEGGGGGNAFGSTGKSPGRSTGITVNTGTKNEKSGCSENAHPPIFLIRNTPSIILVLNEFEMYSASIHMACFTCSKTRIMFDETVQTPEKICLVNLNISFPQHARETLKEYIQVWKKLHSNLQDTPDRHLQSSASIFSDCIFYWSGKKPPTSDININPYKCMMGSIFLHHNGSSRLGRMKNMFRTLNTPFQTPIDPKDEFAEQKIEYIGTTRDSRRVGTMQPLVHQLDSQLTPFKFTIFLGDKNKRKMNTLVSLLRPLEWNVWAWILASVASLQAILLLANGSSGVFWVIEVILGNGDIKNVTGLNAQVLPVFIWVFATFLLQNLYTFSMYSIITTDPLPHVPQSMKELLQTSEADYPRLALAGSGMSKGMVSTMIKESLVPKQVSLERYTFHDGIPKDLRMKTACPLVDDSRISADAKNLEDAILKQNIQDFVKNLSEFKMVWCYHTKIMEFYGGSSMKHDMDQGKRVAMQNLHTDFEKFAWIGTSDEFEYYQWLILLIARVGKRRIISQTREGSSLGFAHGKTEFAIARNYFVGFYETTKSRMVQAGIPIRFSKMLNAVRAGMKIKSLYRDDPKGGNNKSDDSVAEGIRTWNHFATLFANQDIVRGFLEETVDNFKAKAADLHSMKVVWQLYIFMMILSGVMGLLEIVKHWLESLWTSGVM